MGRPKVIDLKKIRGNETKNILNLLYPEKVEWRPKVRGDCVNVPRPCPYVGCRYHLYLDVSERTGSLRINSDDEIWDLEHSCALDIADEGFHSLADIAKILGLTRERARQIYTTAMDTISQDEDLMTFGPDDTDQVFLDDQLDEYIGTEDE